MAKKRNNLYLLYIAIGLMFLCVVLYLIVRNYTSYTESIARDNLYQVMGTEYNDEENDTRRLFVDSNINEQSNHNKVCMTKLQYDLMISKINEQSKPPIRETPPTQETSNRDYRVLSDPLYPPLNRTDAVTHHLMKKNVEQRNMYVNLNDIKDTYRLVGYLVSTDENKDAGGNNWKLFARQKDRHSSDFYIVPSNNNFDIKIQIKNEMIVGERLKDVYSIPNHISFNSPMLNRTPYEFVEISNTDMSSSMYL